MPLFEKKLQAKPKTLILIIEGICSQWPRRSVDLFASNYSTKLENGEFKIDFDRDGLHNNEDRSDVLDLSSRTSDTNADGYSDLLMKLGGFTADGQRFLQKCSLIGQDTDGDWLTDCTEALAQSDPKNPDSDGDSLPDFLELRNGLDPLDASDAVLDPDLDGKTNYDEIKLGTPLNESNSLFDYERSAIVYTKILSESHNKDCFDLKIENIPLVETSNGNLLALYHIEENMTNSTRTIEYAHIVIARQVESETMVVYDYPSLFIEKKGFPVVLP